ncbi:MAG TPA: hypothetical protein VKY66_02765 [Protaetiibacter sp.]|nr:hypothetical protein [Protaetiibacter sp.]
MVYGLDSESHALLAACYEQWARCFPRNVERQLYLDMKNGLKDLEVALPPSLVDRLGVVSGWAPKAVYEVSNRVVFKGVHDDPFGLGDLLHENRFEIELPQAIVSALSQSVAFVSTTPGDTSAGEPEVLFQFHSALWSTGVWDRRLRRLRAGLLVNDIDDQGVPLRMTLLVPGQTVSLVRSSEWYVEAVYDNPLRHRIPMEPLPYRPTLERPFGRSRIDRTVMSLIDRFVRSGSRLDVHAELFSAIKLILLGASQTTFQDNAGNTIPLWRWTMSRLNAIEKDEDGDVPKLEQVAAQSPEPILAYNRQLAAEFSGHTGVPLGSLGIATDNPESQGAKQEARQDIVADVEAQHVVFGAALERAFESALMLRDDTAVAPDLRELKLADSSSWRSPQRPTLQAQGDYGAKVVSVAPDLMQTRVGYELLGLEPGQIDRHEAELRRARAASLVERLAGGAPLLPERGAADVEEV